jgi:thiol-disulfide isomerase/thioredoxin
MNNLFFILILLVTYYLFKKISYVIILLITLFFLTRNTSGFNKGMKIEESKLNNEDDTVTTKTKITQNDIKDDTVLIFYATWCGYCKNAMPGFKEAVTRGKGKVILVDADQNKDLVTKYKIKGFPTIIKGNGDEYKEPTRDADSIIKFLES